MCGKKSGEKEEDGGRGEGACERHGPRAREMKGVGCAATIAHPLLPLFRLPSPIPSAFVPLSSSRTPCGPSHDQADALPASCPCQEGKRARDRRTSSALLASMKRSSAVRSASGAAAAAAAALAAAIVQSPPANSPQTDADGKSISVRRFIPTKYKWKTSHQSSSAAVRHRRHPPWPRSTWRTL